MDVPEMSILRAFARGAQEAVEASDRPGQTCAGGAETLL